MQAWEPTDQLDTMPGYLPTCKQLYPFPCNHKFAKTIKYFCDWFSSKSFNYRQQAYVKIANNVKYLWTVCLLVTQKNSGITKQRIQPPTAHKMFSSSNKLTKI